MIMHAYSYGTPIRVWDIILAHTRMGRPIRVWANIRIWGRTVLSIREAGGNKPYRMIFFKIDILQNITLGFIPPASLIDCTVHAWHVSSPTCIQ